MAPSRPYWKGYLKLSLVSCPIALYTATSPGERVAFRQINKKTGNRLRQQLVDEQTGEPIDPDDKGRGYEVDKGVYLQVEDEELDAIAIESSHTIDIDTFVPKSEIDERYIDSPYYLVPENKVALEAFAVIRDAMRDKNMVALGRVVLSKRERVIMLQPRDKGLLGATLRYPYEIRDESIYFGDIGEIQIPKDMLALAEHILESKAAKFDPSKFHDRYEEAIVTMLNEKKAGMPIAKQRPMPRIVAGTDLMAALRQSIDKAKEEAPTTAAAKQAPPAPAAAAAAATKPAAAPKGKRAAKSNSDQREMLLPIAGGAPAKEASAPAKEAPEKPAAQKPGARKKAG
jgi:DNA end-binding protein Ku